MSIVIKVESLGKLYSLGEIGTGTASHDLARWWARVRGKEDPYTKIGQVNDRTTKASTGDFVWAVKDVSFEISKGEAVGIIGRNGAGKSTILKVLSRITAPTRGEVKVKGRVASLLEVGTGFHPEMTGRENIYMNGTILGMTKREVTRKLEEIVEFAGVAKYVDTPVKRYSSGMMVRLGFAVAAHLELEILIVDEVLAVGDAEFQKKALGKMQDASQKQGRTVLFVSHNMSAVKSICTRCLLFDQGRNTLDGPCQDVIDSYLSNQYVFENIVSDKFDVSGFRILYDDDGRWIEDNQIPFGKNFLFEFEITVKDFFSSNKLYFAFTIFNKDGNKVTTLDNLFSDTPIVLDDHKKFKVQCRVQQNFMIPAEYHIEIWSGTFFETHLDNFLIGKFNIVFSNFFGNGKLHSERLHGNMLLPNTWSKNGLP